MKASFIKDKLEFFYDTPNMKTGYLGIADKTAKNAKAALLLLIAGPILCLGGSLACSLVGKLSATLFANAAFACSALALISAVSGIFLGLATLAIGAKDLAHHIYRVNLSYTARD